MSEGNYNVPDWKQRFAADLNRDKKKTAILAALMLVAVILGARLLLSGGSPQEATAASEASSPAAGTAANMQDPAPVAVVAVVPDRLAQQQELLGADSRKISQDIFQPHLDMYPSEQEVKIVPVPVATTQEAQPTTAPVDPDSEARAIRAQATRLELQSTMISDTSTVIINGRVFRKGDWINDFQILDISPRACVVAQNGVKVTLEMKD